jgi:hypothetical protein
LIQKVLSFQATNEAPTTKGGGDEQQHEEESDDAVSCSSSKLSFKWVDVGSCSSVSASAKDAEQMLTPSRKHYCMSSRLSSMSQRSASVLEPKSMKGMEEGEETCRMGQWIATDSDCEYCVFPIVIYYSY